MCVDAWRCVPMRADAVDAVISHTLDLSVNRKPIFNFLLVINSNNESISYRFRDIDAFSSKLAVFLHPTLV